MRLLVLGCVFLLLAAGRARAQSEVYMPFFYGNPKLAFLDTNPDTGPLKAMPLEILLEEPDPAIVKSLGRKPEELALYQARLAAFNEQLRTAGRFWTYSPTVVVKSKADLAKPVTEVSYHLVLLASTYPLQREYRASDGYYQTTTKMVPSLQLAVVRLGDDKHPYYNPLAGCFYTTQFAKVKPWKDQYSASDVQNTVQQMQRFLEARDLKIELADYEKILAKEIAERGPLLLRKTLLLDGALLESHVTPDWVAQHYPGPVQIVERSVIEAAAATADSRYLYARYTVLYHNHGYQLVDMETGQLVAYAKYSLTKDANPPYVQQWVLEDFAQFAAPQPETPTKKKKS